MDVAARKKKGMNIAVGNTFEMNGTQFIITETTKNIVKQFSERNKNTSLKKSTSKSPNFIRFNLFDGEDASNFFSMILQEEDFLKITPIIKQMNFEVKKFKFSEKIDLFVLGISGEKNILKTFEEIANYVIHTTTVYL